MIDAVAEILFTQGLYKDLEYEAYRVGTLYANRIGYNSRGLKNFIHELGAASGKRASIFSSTHPIPSHRYRCLMKALKKLSRSIGKSLLVKRYLTQTKGRL